MAFRWWANGGPFIVVFGSSLPSSTNKKVGPPLTQLSGSAYALRLCEKKLDPPLTQLSGSAHALRLCDKNQYLTIRSKWVSIVLCTNVPHLCLSFDSALLKHDAKDMCKSKFQKYLKISRTAKIFPYVDGGDGWKFEVN